MPKITDTYALAYACCDRVLQETERFPTIDAIRERIGVNSPNTIKKAMNDWTAAFARKHFEKLHRPDLPVALQDATEVLWQLALKQAALTFQTQTQAYRDEQARLQQWVAKLEAQLQAQETALQHARAQLSHMTETRDALSAQLAEQQQRQAAAQQQIRELQTLQQQGEQQLIQERHQAHTLQQQNEVWYQRRIVEERDLAAEKWQGQVQQVQALNHVLEQNRQQSSQQNKHLQERVKTLQAALVDAQQPGKIKRGSRRSFAPRVFK